MAGGALDQHKGYHRLQVQYVYFEFHGKSMIYHGHYKFPYISLNLEATPTPTPSAPFPSLESGPHVDACLVCHGETGYDLATDRKGYWTTPIVVIPSALKVILPEGFHMKQHFLSRIRNVEILHLFSSAPTTMTAETKEIGNEISKLMGYLFLAPAQILHNDIERNLTLFMRKYLTEIWGFGSEKHFRSERIASHMHLLHPSSIPSHVSASAKSDMSLHYV